MAIEVERRGPLEKEAKGFLLKYLKDNAHFVGEIEQLTVFCDTQGRALGSIEQAKARISLALIADLTTGQVELSLKAKRGKMESSARQEIELPFAVDKFSEVIELLKLFGIEKGCPRFYRRRDYRLDKFLITVKDEGLAKDHFEIEAIVDSAEETKQVLMEMERRVEDLELEFYTEEEYKQMMLDLYQDNPPVCWAEIDFSRFIERAF